MFIVAVT